MAFVSSPMIYSRLSQEISRTRVKLCEMRHRPADTGSRMVHAHQLPLKRDTSRAAVCLPKVLKHVLRRHARCHRRRLDRFRRNSSARTTPCELPALQRQVCSGAAWALLRAGVAALAIGKRARPMAQSPPAGQQRFWSVQVSRDVSDATTTRSAVSAKMAK